MLPLIIDPSVENRANHTLRVVGRLRRGVGLAPAREELSAIAAALEREHPATNTNWGVRLETLADTNMVTSRTREIGVRMATGATRRDVMAFVVRQGMTWAVSGIVLGLLGA